MYFLVKTKYSFKDCHGYKAYSFSGLDIWQQELCEYSLETDRLFIGTALERALKGNDQENSVHGFIVLNLLFHSPDILK